MNSPCCGFEVIDLDCYACLATGAEDNGDTCTECDGMGYIADWYECPECGNTFHETDCV